MEWVAVELVACERVTLRRAVADVLSEFPGAVVVVVVRRLVEWVVLFRTVVRTAAAVRTWLDRQG